MNKICLNQHDHSCEGSSFNDTLYNSAYSVGPARQTYQCHFMERGFVSIRKLFFVRFTLCRTAPEPICQEADAPAVTHAAVTSWQKSMASLEGDITCHGDYLYSGDDTPQVRCLATGQWDTHVTGECKQRIWRENSVSVGQRFGQHKRTWPTRLSFLVRWF